MCASDSQGHCPQTLPCPFEEKQRLPRRVSPSESAMYRRNRFMIASMPRNILGVSVITALARAFGRPMPNAPRDPMDEARKSAELIDKMRKEIAAEEGETGQATQEAWDKLRPPSGPIQVVDAAQEVRDSAVVIEAQSAFEAQMRAKDLRDSLK